MREVNIYIATSIKGRWNRDGYIGYYLEYYPKGRKYPRTRQGYAAVTDMNENRAVIEALIRAMSRMTEKCILSIYTESEYLYSGLRENGYISKWLKAGWKNSRGQEIKNKDKWQKLTGALQGNTYSCYLKGTNAYIPRIKSNLQHLENGTTTIDILNKEIKENNNV